MRCATSATSWPTLSMMVPTCVTTSLPDATDLRLSPDRLVDLFHFARQGIDAAANFLGRLAGLDRERLDLGGNDGEAAPGLAGTGGLDSGIQRKQVGLAGDAIDGVRHLADLIDGRLQNRYALADGARALLNRAHGIDGCAAVADAAPHGVARVLGLAGAGGGRVRQLGDRSCHFLDGARDRDGRLRHLAEVVIEPAKIDRGLARLRAEVAHSLKLRLVRVLDETHDAAQRIAETSVECDVRGQLGSDQGLKRVDERLLAQGICCRSGALRGLDVNGRCLAS